MNDNFINIEIEKSLHEKMKNRIKDSSNEFETVDLYANYILTEVLNDMENDDSEDRKMVEKELKKLGYI
jgi:hypothetical protein